MKKRLSGVESEIKERRREEISDEADVCRHPHSITHSFIPWLKNLVEPDNAWPFILLKMAGNGIMHHCSQFFEIVGLGIDRVTRRMSLIPSLRGFPGNEYDFLFAVH
ncbi:hypothetical protein [Methanocalculus sp. MSAO_Arc2]|uniref:hypothetical protein n=1 Tax=Methanocalculus sp. MSAO_Arc2 TaxID=2293855 RepID=UPI0032168FE7